MNQKISPRECLGSCLLWTCSCDTASSFAKWDRSRSLLNGALRGGKLWRTTWELRKGCRVARARWLQDSELARCASTRNGCRGGCLDGCPCGCHTCCPCGYPYGCRTCCRDGFPCGCRSDYPCD